MLSSLLEFFKNRCVCRDIVSETINSQQPADRMDFDVRGWEPFLHPVPYESNRHTKIILQKEVLPVK